MIELVELIEYTYHIFFNFLLYLKNIFDMIYISIFENKKIEPNIDNDYQSSESEIKIKSLKSKIYKEFKYVVKFFYLIFFYYFIYFIVSKLI